MQDSAHAGLNTGIGRLNGKNWPNSASLPIALLFILLSEVHVKYERVINKSIPTTDLNANLHLTLKLVTLKVKVNIKGCNG